MPFFVYILYSKSIDQFYIGHTQNLDDRLYRHNNSGSLATKKARDWQIVYTEPFDSRADATKRERQIKAQKSRTFIQALIQSKG